MPTPSEPQPRGEWAPGADPARRSVFGNYRPSVPEEPAPAVSGSAPAAEPAAADEAVARAFIYRWLAKAYEDPTPGGWEWLTCPTTAEAVQLAADALSLPVIPVMPPDAFDPFHSAYLATFGHASRGQCPLNEIEYGDIKADPLFQPHRLADLAAFYRAFGLEIAEDAGERHDHISLELEFMCVLAAKEAYAVQEELSTEALNQCRDAQKKFLREHLGRWTPAFSRRLIGTAQDPVLRSLAESTRGFVEAECLRFGIAPGSEDLLLRPVDEQAESMCGSCGLSSAPPA